MPDPFAYVINQHFFAREAWYHHPEAILEAAREHLVAAEPPRITPFADLVAQTREAFYGGSRDLYFWDEMYKLSEMRWLADNAPFQGPVIDLCCGFAHWMSRTVRPIDLGVDYFPEHSHFARSVESFVRDKGFIDNCFKAVLRADVTRPLPLPAGCCGTLVSICAFEHLPQSGHAGLFANISHLLKPGGRLICSVQLKRSYDAFDAYITPGRVADIRETGVVTELFDETYWLEQIRQAGLEVVRVRGAIDRRLSLLHALSFSANGYAFNKDTFLPELSTIMRTHIPADCGFYEAVIGRLTGDVPIETADLLLLEARKTP